MRGKNGANADAFASILTMQWRKNTHPKRVRILTQLLTPTGCNYQPQRILVLNTDESVEKLKGCTRCHFNAPCAFLVCYNKGESWVRPYDGALSASVDASIVGTHMMLAAHNEGVGCCWVMHFNPEEIIKTFNIPENVVPAALLVMGYPSEDAKPLELHSKYRPMEETVFYDEF